MSVLFVTFSAGDDVANVANFANVKLCRVRTSTRTGFRDKSYILILLVKYLYSMSNCWTVEPLISGTTTQYVPETTHSAVLFRQHQNKEVMDGGGVKRERNDLRM